MDKAFFVKHPGTYLDLAVGKHPGITCPFQIMKSISLDRLDFQNFIYGMDADREYIEKYASLCSDGTVKKCLLIKDGQKPGGILVIPDPEGPCYVLWAAWKLSE